MGQPFVKSILAISGSVLLALIYILAPVQQGILAWAHDLEHEFYHITSSAHEHGFLSADELLAEAGHDHRTLEYIKQVLEPFEDDFKKEEEKNQMPIEILEKTKKEFDERIVKIDWEKHYKDLPFNKSALALYEWSPIADELKSLDRKIVLNSMILKWDIIKKEFSQIINF